MLWISINKKIYAKLIFERMTGIVHASLAECGRAKVGITTFGLFLLNTHYFPLSLLHLAH